MRVFLKTEDEIELMRKANLLVSKTLLEVGKHIKPGVSTLTLDMIAESFIRDHGAVPTFKGFPNPFGNPFPGSICTSVNSVVVHGVPSATMILKDGDIISVDCGVLLNGFNGDSCYTFTVGEVSTEIQRLLHITKQSLYEGISKALPGNRIGDISHAIQSLCESNGYGVVRELTGHGIGRQMHEDPPVPNYGSEGTGLKIRNGLCIAIEPMITLGKREIGLLPDKWSIMTLDRKPAAHFEHTIAIHNDRVDILSSFDELEKL